MYHMLCLNGSPLAGAFDRKDKPVCWQAFLGTKDVDGTLVKAKEHGATIVTEGVDIPGGFGRFGIFQDPTGVTVALYTPPGQPAADKGKKRKAPAKAKASPKKKKAKKAKDEDAGTAEAEAEGEADGEGAEEDGDKE